MQDCITRSATECAPISAAHADVVELLLSRLPLRDAISVSCTTRNLAVQSLPVVNRTFGCAACGTPLFDPRSIALSLLWWIDELD